jgi:hypothetical protein
MVFAAAGLVQAGGAAEERRVEHWAHCCWRWLSAGAVTAEAVGEWYRWRPADAVAAAVGRRQMVERYSYLAMTRPLGPEV